MPKQIKIGFDRIPVPAENTFEPLLDIGSGQPLRTSGGQQIYTQELTPLPSFGVSKNSTPVVVNEGSNALKVIEQFPEVSQVSNSLLGIPRAETQLSLFSDVSTYGFDNNNWDEFTYEDGLFEPIEWRQRKNPTYGRRDTTRLIEVPNEQALALTSFTVPWSFPYGPKFEDVGYYREDLFTLYKDFIQLGNQLYDEYYNQRNLKEFADKTFLSREYASVGIGDNSNDVIYNTNDYSIQTIFDEIEKWTISWMKLRDNELFDPDFEKVNFPLKPDGTSFNANNTRPGYFSQRFRYGEISSKKSFRYQPGRISGFTMGLRASSDPGSSANVIEWGCSNDTDEYMFQIIGSQFNIVRRSVIPLPEANLKRMGLTKEDQKREVPLNPLKNEFYRQNYADDVGDAPVRWETVIPRDKFNGDQLNGNGPSGYIISFEQVTMWKIEFSWYGAIGARFYVYTPTGNGDARWILIHTLVIENELNEPCLKDPFFKHKYVIALRDTSNLRSPQYVYKYGASYYIDGGDEGTTSVHSYSSNIVETAPNETRSVLGVTAKNFIKNSDGVGTVNRKDIIPQKMTITASTPTRVDIIDCEGCPGFGHHYAPSLRHFSATGQGYSGITGTLKIGNDGKTAQFEPNDPNQALIISTGTYSKIIGDGLYSSYLYQDGNNLYIARRNANSIKNNEIQKTADYSKTAEVKKADGSLITTVKGGTFTNVRITGFDDIVAGPEPLTKNNINVNFLNPIRRDGPNHYAEFFIGITNLKPELVINPFSGENELLFNNAPLDQNTLLFGEFCQYSAHKDYAGIDFSEWEPRYGEVFGLDPRLSRPGGRDSGICSQAQISVTQQNFDAAYSSTNPETSVPGHYLIFDEGSAFKNFNGLLNGELGRLQDGIYVNANVVFEDDTATEYTDINTFETKYYIRISGPLTGVTKIAIKIVELKGRFVTKSKAFTWDVHPLYVVIGMRDGAQMNNVTVEEYDELDKFSYSPNWLISDSTKINVVNSYSGNFEDNLNPSTGLFESGGQSFPGNPPTNFVENFRLDSAEVDTQLQQPLRPGEIRTTVFLGENETAEIDLTHVFGQDRYTITPGLLNAKASFITAKALESPGEIQINLQSKEQ